MVPSTSAALTTDASVWRAIAGPAVRIPPPDSYVYYFPEGHLEQYGDAGAARNPITALDGRPYISCRVISVGLFYHPKTDHPFAQILLQPEYYFFKKLPKENDNSEKNDGVSYCVKVLSASDATNTASFTLPRSCPDLIFPPLARQKVQNLTIKDMHGNAWKFQHIYEVTTRRHLLTTGWTKFVKAKGLIPGDSIVFIRKTNPGSSNELFVGIRKAIRYNGNANEATEEMKKAANGKEFEVVYCPKVGSPDFVVRTEVVKESVRIQWRRENRVKMKVASDTWLTSHGTIKAILVIKAGPWRNSPWRILQVAWDEPNNGIYAERVSPWEVEQVHTPQLILQLLPQSEKFKASSLDHHGGAVQVRDQSQNPSQTFTDDQPLMMYIDQSDDKDDDDGYVRQHEKSNDGGSSSFQLFGLTIDVFDNSQGGSTKKPK